MRNWGAWKRLLCGLLAAGLLLAAPLDGALAARQALVRVSSATARTNASGRGKAAFTLKKGAKVTVTAVRGSVARVTYKGKTGYLLTSCLSLSAAKRGKAAPRRGRLQQQHIRPKTGKLEAGDFGTLLDTGQLGQGSKGRPDRLITKAPSKPPRRRPRSRTKSPRTNPRKREGDDHGGRREFFAKSSQAAAYKKSRPAPR